MQQENEALLRLGTNTQLDSGKGKAKWQGKLSPNNTGNSAMLRDIQIDLTPAPVRSIYEILLSPKTSPH